MRFRCYEDKDGRDAVVFDAPDPRTAAEMFPHKLIAEIAKGLEEISYRLFPDASGRTA